MRQGDYGVHRDFRLAEHGKARANRCAGRDDIVHEDHALSGKGVPQPEGSERVVGARTASESRLLARVAGAFEQDRGDARRRAPGERSSEERSLVIAPLDQARAVKRYGNPGISSAELELFDPLCE